MKKITTLVFAIILSSCATTTPYRDIRIGHWQWWGADKKELETVIKKIKESDNSGAFWDVGDDKKPGDWRYEFGELGLKYERKAFKKEVEGKKEEASRLYDRASVYYGLGKYPLVERNDVETRLNKKHIEAYIKSWKLSKYAFEVVHGKFNEKKTTGYLHLPNRKKKYPLILGANGLDVHAAESGPFVKDLLERGFVVLMFDIPGTAAHSHIKLTPSGDGIYSSFINLLSKHKNINTKVVGAFGISFAGNLSTKLAYTEKRVRAVANICGLIHSVFQMSPAQVNSVEKMYADGFRDRVGLEKYDPKKIAKILRGFSLISQGHIKKGEKTTKTPIISLNAKNDYVAPESDMELASNSSVDGKIVFSGADDHCPQDRPKHMPVVADWFAEKLLK